MQTMITTPTLAQVLDTVKPDMNSQLPLLPDSVRHHSNPHNLYIRGNRDKVWRETRYYGVSSDYRILTKELLLKRFDKVRDCLKFVLDLPTAEREFILRMLRLWAYYGKCYPTVASLCQEPGCSKATAWRALDKLKSCGLIQTINRYLEPYRRQISNLYILHGLLLVIAKYLAEHIPHVWPDELKPIFHLTWPGLWSSLRHEEKNAFLLFRSSGLPG